MITLDQEIAELRREIAMRRRLYPQWVANNRLTQEAASRQIDCLEATLARLQAIKGERAPSLPGLDGAEQGGKS